MTCVPFPRPRPFPLQTPVRSKRHPKTARRHLPPPLVQSQHHHEPKSRHLDQGHKSAKEAETKTKRPTPMRPRCQVHRTRPTPVRPSDAASTHHPAPPFPPPAAPSATLGTLGSLNEPNDAPAWIGASGSPTNRSQASGNVHRAPRRTTPPHPQPRPPRSRPPSRTSARTTRRWRHPRT